MENYIFEKNMRALKDRYEEIAEYIENRMDCSEKNSSSLEVNIEKIDKETALYVIYKNDVIQLNSLYSNEELLNEWVKMLAIENYYEMKVFIFGLGDGSFARKLLSCIPGRVTVVVEEPTWDIINMSIRHFDMSDLFANRKFNLIMLPLLKNTKISNVFPQYLTYKDINSARVLCYPNYDLIYHSEYEDYAYSVKTAASNVNCNQNLYANCGKECNENTFKNVTYFLDSRSLPNLIGNMPKGFPAIVVAGGPSLDKNVNQLKKAKGKALIVCTDTALRPVIQAGVIPDIAISSDAFKGEKYFSEELSREVPLVCSTHVGYKAMSCHKGIKFLYNNMDMWINKFALDEGINLMFLESGGSVANDALSLARGLGADRIILIGQDLAYTDDKTHSTTTVEGELNNKDFRYMIWDTDIYGNPIKTSEQFVLYRDWIEETIIKFKDTISVIDATEGGILIKGSEIMTLEDAISRECTEEYDFETIIKNSDELLNSCQKELFIDHMCLLPERYEEISEKIEKAMSIYSEMKWMARNGHMNLSKMRNLSGKSQKLLDEITEANEMEYVLNLIQKEINEVLQKINVMEDNDKDDILSVCDYGIGTLTAMRNGIEIVTPQINEMIELLEAYRC